MGTKLSVQDVLHIRKYVAEGGSRRDMAAFYRVGLETVSRAVRGDTHAGVQVKVLREDELAEASRKSQEKFMELMEKESRAEDEPAGKTAGVCDDLISDAVREQARAYGAKV